MKKVLSVFGTRPEAIKMAPVIRELQRYPERFSVRVCVTAQHRDMLDQALSIFGITPDYDLDIMQPNRLLARLTAAIFTKLEPCWPSKDQWVLVQGDTTTVIAASLLAYYYHIRVGHVEAGLRSGDKAHPFPEEVTAG